MKKLSLTLVVILIVLCNVVFASCNGGGNTTVADNTQYYDAITSTLKLGKSFEGKNFLTEGIGRATVDAFTDGDTTRFKLEQGDIISVRYYQVDTPESTGNVQKWGKAASLFAKTRLSEATEIVLEATATRAEKDSYGTRYLAYVWADGVLVNLEVVQNGYSNCKLSSSSKYFDAMYETELFISKTGRRVWGEIDPNYDYDRNEFK